MDESTKRNEYARQYRERNRELLRAKERERRAKMPPKPARARPTPEERFWPKVKRAGPDQCWEWQAGKSHGYGSFRLTPRRAVGAHCFSWELVNGPIPEGKHVLHHCDNPPCCNPAHLYIGTDKENARDRMERGQFVSNIHHARAKLEATGHNSGRKYPNRKPMPLLLNEAQVREIRQRYAAGGCTMRSLAQEFGVTHPTIKNVIHGIGGYGRVT